jgi:very-short-patch-repair endonuclease
MSLQNERLLALLEYTKQTVLLKKSPTTNIAQCKDFSHTEDRVFQLPGIALNVMDSEVDEVWLRVERLHETCPPDPTGDQIAAWVELSRDPAKEPTLKSSVLEQTLIDLGVRPTPLALPDALAPVPAKALPMVLLADYEGELARTNAPSLDDQLKTYVATLWRPWAAKEKKIRKSISFYSELFMLSQKLQGNLVDTALELVWGVGMAAWKLDKCTISYPLLTQSVELSLNDKTMALEIRPSNFQPRLELDIYAALDNPGVAKLEEIGKKFFEESHSAFTPFEPGCYEQMLRSATSMLDATGTYWPDQTTAADRKLPKPGETLCVTDTWVLLARPRTTNLMVQDLARFEQKLTDDTAAQVLPDALKALFTDPSTINEEFELPPFRGLSVVSGSGKSSGKSPSDLYFPKAFNDEQVQIVQMLEVHDGVVVQGPPGTGKTHTIANVICHYLASGKRVLVTSMKDPALAVLQEKLPEAIRPLAISLLSSEADGMRQFEFAINKISAEVTRIDKVAYARDIQANTGQIDATHARLAKIDQDIAHWAQLNLIKIDLDGEILTPVDIAADVASHRLEATWFPDTLTIDPKHRPQFDNHVVVSMRAARRALGDDLAYLGKRIPSVESFPSTARLLQVHRDLGQLSQLRAREDQGLVPRLADVPNAIPAASITLAKLAAMRELTVSIEAAHQPWATGLQDYLQKHGKNEVLDLFFQLQTELRSALAERKQFLARPIALPDGFDANPILTEAVRNLAQGKKPFGLAGLFGKADEKRILDAVSVVHAKPSTVPEWQHVQAFLHYSQTVKSLLVRWNTLADELRLPLFDVKASRLLAVGEVMALIDKILEWVAAEKSVSGDVKALVPTWVQAGQRPMTLAVIEDVAAILEHHLAQHRLAETWLVKEEILQALHGSEGGVTQQLRVFLGSTLGSTEVSDEQLQRQWMTHMQELQRLHALSEDLNTVETGTALVAASGAVEWANRLRNDAHGPWLPDNWAAVWRLNRLIHFVDNTDSRQELKRLSQLRNELEADLSKLYLHAVSTRTWLKLAENATPDVRAALEAYRSAIKKIGKGTGIRAGRFRQDARQAADRANQAIPCWIMPHYRISESLPANFGAFDLVIIDEASQSDLTALTAILRAKKVLIVGDDMQVSPEGVGLEEEKIKNLMHRFLGNQVDLYRPQMTPDRSIYDLFKVVFANSAVMLREHFRCVSPIIEYSKREFYNHELKPLRLPRRSERLDPPLVDVYVADGYRSKDLNLPEARFIVDEIKSIVANPALEGRSIGVVSLIGSEQALRIMQMLNEELGEQTVTKYKITCGDARTFQGKERDIMFLSMIAAPGNAHAQTQAATAQRFNVAASRARDRMYLVRSIRLEELSQADVLRSKLIQHFQAPFLQNEQDLSSNREKCESPFEREVYDILIGKGYRVIPQVPVGAYRIDMVVEGDNDSRLAIECDGDRYHGPDQWDNDMRRQRILERAGWRFWRSFASTFVLHKQEVVNDLVEALQALDIHPTSLNAPVASIHVESRTITAQGPSEGALPPRDLASTAHSHIDQTETLELT